MSFSILSIGSELIKGKILDTNSQFIAKELHKKGFNVSFQMTCSDDENDILASFEFLFKNSDCIITTGGLGPTRDDITLKVVSQFLKRKLVYSEEAWENCVSHFHKIGKKLFAESNKKTAYIPEGAQFLKNPYGSSGAVLNQFQIGSSQKSILSFPGIPYELESLFSKINLSSYQISSLGKMGQKVIYFYSVGESNLQDMLKPIESSLSQRFQDLEFSYRVRNQSCFYSIEYRYENDTERLEFLDAFSEEFREIKKDLEKNIVFESEESLETTFINKLKEKGLTFAVCDSFLKGALIDIFEKYDSEMKLIKGAMNFSYEKLLKVFQLSSEGPPKVEELSRMLLRFQDMIHTRLSLFELGLEKKESFFLARLFICFEDLDVNLERVKSCFPDITVFDFSTQSTKKITGVFLKLAYRDFLSLTIIRKRLLLDVLISIYLSL